MANSRGVTVGKKFNARQLRAIELFAIGSYSCQDIASDIGVTNKTISVWRRNSQFMDAIITRAREILKESLPELYNVALDESVKGSPQFLKIILDHLDKLEATKAMKSDSTITFKWDI